MAAAAGAAVDRRGTDGNGSRTSTPGSNLVAGAISSFITCVTFQPLDVLKTRLQLLPPTLTRPYTPHALQ